MLTSARQSIFAAVAVFVWIGNYGHCGETETPLKQRDIPKAARIPLPVAQSFEHIFNLEPMFIHLQHALWKAKKDASVSGRADRYYEEIRELDLHLHFVRERLEIALHRPSQTTGISTARMHRIRREIEQSKRSGEGMIPKGIKVWTPGPIYQ